MVQNTKQLSFEVKENILPLFEISKNNCFRIFTWNDLQNWQQGNHFRVGLTDLSINAWKTGKRHEANAKSSVYRISNMSNLVYLGWNLRQNLAKWSFNTVQLIKLESLHCSYFEKQFTVQSKFSFSLKMNIERAFGEGSTWNYTVCERL